MNTIKTTLRLFLMLTLLAVSLPAAPPKPAAKAPMLFAVSFHQTINAYTYVISYYNSAGGIVNPPTIWSSGVDPEGYSSWLGITVADPTVVTKMRFTNSFGACYKFWPSATFIESQVMEYSTNSACPAGC
jgi:hypothetical protein